MSSGGDASAELDVPYSAWRATASRYTMKACVTVRGGP
jgi:hypothetical protein